MVASVSCRSPPSHGCLSTRVGRRLSPVDERRSTARCGCIVSVSVRVVRPSQPSVRTSAHCHWLRAQQCGSQRQPPLTTMLPWQCLSTRRESVDGSPKSHKSTIWRHCVKKWQMTLTSGIGSKHLCYADSGTVADSTPPCSYLILAELVARRRSSSTSTVDASLETRYGRNAVWAWRVELATVPEPSWYECLAIRCR